MGNKREWYYYLLSLRRAGITRSVAFAMMRSDFGARNDDVTRLVIRSKDKTMRSWLQIQKTRKSGKASLQQDLLARAERRRHSNNPPEPIVDEPSASNDQRKQSLSGDLARAAARNRQPSAAEPRTSPPSATRPSSTGNSDFARWAARRRPPRFPHR